MQNLTKDETLIELKKNKFNFINFSAEVRSDKEIILEAIKEEYNLRFLTCYDYQLYGQEINKIAEETRMKNAENDKKAQNLGKKIMWITGIGGTIVSVGVGYLFSFSADSFIWLTTGCWCASMVLGGIISYANSSEAGKERALDNFINNCDKFNKANGPVDNSYYRNRANEIERHNNFVTRSHTIPSHKVRDYLIN